MQTIARRDLARMQGRIKRIYLQLGGDPMKFAVNSNDFRAALAQAAAEGAALAELASQRARLEGGVPNYITRVQLEFRAKDKHRDAEQRLAKAEAVSKEIAKYEGDKELKAQRDRAIDKLRLVFTRLKEAGGVEQAELLQGISPKDDESGEIVFLPPTWAAKNENLEAKLEIVTSILSRLALQNANLGDGIDTRNLLAAETNQKTVEVSRILKDENHKLSEVLKSYRSPCKLCCDCCCFVILLGLLTMIFNLLGIGN